MRRWLALLVFLLAACQSTPILEPPRSSVDIRATDGDGTVYGGSGCVIAVTEKGYYVLTAGHVIGFAETLPKWRTTFTVDGQAAEFVAQRRYWPEGMDLGLLLVRGTTDAVPRPVSGESWTGRALIFTRMDTKVARQNDDGTLDVRPRVIPGDSGSAVVCNGSVVGVVYAMSMPDQDRAYYTTGAAVLEFLRGKIQ